MFTKWMWVFSAIFVTASIVSKLLHAPETVLFGLACFAIIPLAGLMGSATESISVHAGPRVGGLLSATFGNAVELIIGVFALSNGYIKLVTASITGSIISNLLLVLGASFFVGGVRHPVQRFNIRVARSNASMLLLGIGVAFVVPAIFATGGRSVSLSLSGAVALVSFVLYISGLFFSLFTHREIFSAFDTGDQTAHEDEGPRWRLMTSIIVLAVTTFAVSVESDWLVGGVRAVGTRLGWNELFVGVVVVAIVGNAAEHASAVWMAWKDRMDISLEIAVGSSLQVAMFVTPVLYLAGICVGNPFAIVFSLPELASMLAAVILVVVLMMDGESNWLEGAMAVGAYLVMAVGFFTL